MRDLVKVAEQYLGAGLEVRKGLVEYYNRYCLPLVKPSRKYKMQLGDNWCAMFVSVVAHKAGYSANQFPYEVSVFYQCEIAKQWGAFNTGLAGAVAGDLIIYDWLGNGSYDHVGIIKQIGVNHLITIEGNYSGTVKHRTLNPSSKAIKGFIRLSGAEHSGEYTRLEDLTKAVMLGEYGNGEQRKKALGSDYHRVQEMVNNILR